MRLFPLFGFVSHSGAPFSSLSPPKAACFMLRRAALPAQPPLRPRSPCCSRAAQGWTPAPSTRLHASPASPPGQWTRSSQTVRGVQPARTGRRTHKAEYMDRGDRGGLLIMRQERKVGTVANIPPLSIREAVGGYYTCRSTWNLIFATR